jgi:hypothetical protein
MIHFNMFLLIMLRSESKGFRISFMANLRNAATSFRNHVVNIQQIVMITSLGPHF